MSLPEVCGVWIEQRLQEEIDRQGDTGASLREIGRIIAAEVEKHFETKVSPGTIFQRARRISADTNVSHEGSEADSGAYEEIKQNSEIKQPSRGGARKGAGRKPNERREEPPHDPGWGMFEQTLGAIVDQLAVQCTSALPSDTARKINGHIRAIKAHMKEYTT